jgi:DNA-directed RNA polymerase specialized sigma24 family protein
LEERSFKDLAGEWRVPIGTLLARKSRGLEKIREQLTGRINTNQGAQK